MYIFMVIKTIMKCDLEKTLNKLDDVVVCIKIGIFHHRMHAQK